MDLRAVPLREPMGRGRARRRLKESTAGRGGRGGFLFALFC